MCVIRVLSSFLCIIVLSTVLSPVSAKEKWYIAETENLLVYSNASKSQTEKTIEDLHAVQHTLSQVFPHLSDKKDKKIRVFIAKNGVTTRRFSSLYQGKAKNIGGLFAKDHEGDLMLINADGEFEQTRSTVYHEYVHFLTVTRKFYIPPWLNEGIAEAFSTIEFTKREAKVGLSDRNNSIILANEKLIPFERFFQVTRASPEYNSSNHGQSIFYAQSWALVHYLIYGKHQLPKDLLPKVVQLAAAGKTLDEETFKKISGGLGFLELTKAINRYVSSGRYTYYKYPLPEENDTEIALAEASEGEIELIHGILLLRTRGPEEAYAHIAKAYSMLPDSPRAAAYYGYYLYRQKLYDEATEKFAEAIERGTKVPADHLYHASAYMRSKNPKLQLSGSFYDNKETLTLLTSLFEARKLGEKRDQLYHRISEVWVGSELTPEPGHIAVVIEGIKLHKGDLFLQYCLASLYVKTNKFESATLLIDNALENPKVGSKRNNFENLKKRIARKKSRGS